MASNTITSNFAWKLAERILARGIEFIVSIVVARLLAPDDYGVIAIVLVFISLADVFVFTGFTSALIQNKDSDETDFSTMFYCSLIMSAVLYAVIYVLAPYIAEFYQIESLTIITRVFAIKIPLSVYNSIQHAYVSRHMLFKRFFMSTFTGTVLSGVVGIYLAYQGAGVWALVSQYFVNTIGDTLILAYTVKWYPKFLFSWQRAIKLMDYGWKVLASEFFGVFFGQLRNLVVGKYFTPSNLAIYNRGQHLPNLLYQNLGTSITSVLFPALSNYSDDFAKIKDLTKRTTRLLAFVLFPLFTILIVTARPLTIILLTEKWIESVPFLQILSLDYIIAIWGIGILPAIKATGRSDIVLKLEFVKKPIFVVLLLIGVKLGLYAVAITMVIYELVATLINFYYANKIIDYSIRESINDVYAPFVYCFLSGIISSAVAMVFENDVVILFFQIIVIIIIYVVLATLFHDKTVEYVYNKFVKRI